MADEEGEFGVGEEGGGAAEGAGTKAFWAFLLTVTRDTGGANNQIRRKSFVSEIFDDVSCDV